METPNTVNVRSKCLFPLIRATKNGNVFLHVQGVKNSELLDALFIFTGSVGLTSGEDVKIQGGSKYDYHTFNIGAWIC